MRSGVRLGIDVGSVRVGVARSDPAGMLATPVRTVRRNGKVAKVAKAPKVSSPPVDGPRPDLDEIAALVVEHDVIEVIVGLPRGLSGNEGAAAKAARSYAQEIENRIRPVPVRFVDERLSTVSAQRSLREAGVSTRKHRPVVDQAAAVVILQSALDAERASGRAPGTALTDSVPENPVPENAVPENPVSENPVTDCPLSGDVALEVDPR
ncbi:MAG: putative pre6S rRNA nuclease [Actinomycetota bacterium]|nr:putative pre6S rRNA nuclease [Actinomycetota bacterium]